MSIYTPPALNAVDFALTAYTPADITPYEIGLSSYTPPALNAVNFALTAYTIPTFPDVGWELLPSVEQIATITTGQGGQTSDITATLTLSAAIETGQGSQTTDITAILAYMAGIETGQGSQTTNGVLSGETPTPPVIIGGGGDGFIRRGNLLTYVRPKDLGPDVALNRVVKRVAKRLKIKRVDARYLVEWAQQAFTALPEYRPVQNLALSVQNKDLEKRQIAQIKAYWAALEQAAIEQAEEDEEILLWLS